MTLSPAAALSPDFPAVERVFLYFLYCIVAGVTGSRYIDGLLLLWLGLRYSAGFSTFGGPTLFLVTVLWRNRTPLDLVSTLYPG